MYIGLRPLLKFSLYLIFLLVLAGSIWLVSIVSGSSTGLEKALITTIESMLVQRAENFAQQFRNEYRTVKDLPEYFLHHPKAQKICNEKLELMRDRDIRFVYLLWLDSQGKFRFLCDGSESKGRVMQKFDPDDPDLWRKIYRSGIATIVDQTQFNELWKSMLIPIRDGGTTRAMLVIDYSTDFLENLKRLSAPIQKTLRTILYITAILVVFIIVQLILLYVIRNKSVRDSLTEIYNRNILTQLRFTLPLHHYHLLMIDLDHFKRINDTYGHDVGDQALRHSVHLLKSLMKKKDFLIRYGGEEFLLLSHCKGKDPTEGRRLAAKVLESFRHTPLEHPTYGKIYLKASIGLFLCPPRNLSFNTVLKEADLALYRAKKAGRDCFMEVSAEKNNIAQKESLDFTQIKRLIEQDCIRCVYQPIYDHRGIDIVKYETLVRLVDEKGTMIPPKDFLPVIWHTNTYVRMTRIVLEKAIRTFRNRKGVHFTVNLTLQDLLDEQIISELEELATRERETVSRMGIEILEYHHFENIERLRETLNWLKRLGISIILDDFGSGHANFFILQYLPVDEFKIDRRMILEAMTNQKAKKLLISLAQYARDTGLKTTAEYISDERIFAMIQQIPVDYLQGFYLGEPLSEPEESKKTENR